MTGINLYTPSQRQNSFMACEGVFPEQNPELTLQPTYFNGTKWQLRRLCSNDFAILYSDRSKTPLLAIEKISAKHLKANIKRTDEFYPDPRTPNKQQAKLSDYRGQNQIDRGHLAPAANASSALAMAQSFALSNIVPQNADLNRGAWKKIETDVRKYALRSKGDIYIITGVLFNGKIQKIGKNQVYKPSHLFKVVYDPKTNTSWAYLFENKAKQPIKQLSYQEFSKKTGIKFGFLEQGFSTNSNALLGGLATTLAIEQMTDYLPELPNVSEQTESLWESFKQKLYHLWNSLLKHIVGWLKANDRNE